MPPAAAGVGFCGGEAAAEFPFGSESISIASKIR